MELLRYIEIMEHCIGRTVEKQLLPMQPGDLIVLFQSGAYGRSASPREFLGHPDVREALV